MSAWSQRPLIVVVPRCHIVCSLCNLSISTIHSVIAPYGKRIRLVRPINRLSNRRKRYKWVGLSHRQTLIILKHRDTRRSQTFNLPSLRQRTERKVLRLSHRRRRPATGIIRIGKRNPLLLTSTCSPREREIFTNPRPLNFDKLRKRPKLCWVPSRAYRTPELGTRNTCRTFNGLWQLRSRTALSRKTPIRLRVLSFTPEGSTQRPPPRIITRISLRRRKQPLRTEARNRNAALIRPPRGRHRPKRTSPRGPYRRNPPLKAAHQLGTTH